jgi:fluoroquinolone resistance protein
VFENCTFSRTSLVGAAIGYEGSVYTGCVFEMTDFRRAVFIRPEFNRVSFHDAKLKGVDFNGSSFEDCPFEGRVEDVWFRGGFPHASLVDDFGVPRVNHMHNVSFLNSSLRGAFFTDSCDLSSIVLPKMGGYRLYSDWFRRLSALGRACEEWKPDERDAVKVFVNAHLIHAEKQNWFLLNADEINDLAGMPIGEQVLRALDSASISR